MIKRGYGAFKIIITMFVIILSALIVLINMTNLLDMVSVEKCLIGYVICAVLIPILTECIIYCFGRVTRCIYYEYRELEIAFEPISETTPCFVNLESGIEKCVFFSGEGLTITGDKKDIVFFYGESENKIVIHIKQGVCKGLFKLIYGNTAENVKYDVYTTLIHKN